MKKEIIKLTRAGYDEKVARRKELLAEEEIVDVQLAEARAQGDYSENSDLDAARKRKEEIHNEIKRIEEIIANAEIIDESDIKNLKHILLGTTVVFKNLNTGAVSEYTIVNSIEADPLKKQISKDCLVGAALIGKCVGDIVEIKTANPYKIEVLEIKFLKK